MQLPAPQSNPWPMGPSFVGLSAAIHSKIVCCSKQWCCLNSTRVLCPAQILRLRTPAPLQQQSMVGSPCGNTPLFFQGWAAPLSQLNGASVLVLHLDRWGSISTVDSFSFLILAFVCHAYPAFVLHPRFHQKPQSLFVGFRLCF